MKKVFLFFVFLIFSFTQINAQTYPASYSYTKIFTNTDSIQSSGTIIFDYNLKTITIEGQTLTIIYEDSNQDYLFFKTLDVSGNKSSLSIIFKNDIIQYIEWDYLTSKFYK